MLCMLCVPILVSIDIISAQIFPEKRCLRFFFLFVVFTWILVGNKKEVFAFETNTDSKYPFKSIWNVQCACLLVDWNRRCNNVIGYILYGNRSFCFAAVCERKKIVVWCVWWPDFCGFFLRKNFLIFGKGVLLLVVAPGFRFFRFFFYFILLTYKMNTG